MVRVLEFQVTMLTPIVTVVPTVISDNVDLGRMSYVAVALDQYQGPCGGDEMS